MMRFVHGFLIVLHTMLGAGEVAQMLNAPSVVANVANVESEESPAETDPAPIL
jgi:hypothetical protein